MLCADLMGALTNRKITNVIDLTAKAALEEAVKNGICPIPLKLQLMRHYWKLATGGDPDGEIVSLVHAELAAEQATDIAPYVHPKIASIDLSNKDGDPLRFLFAPEDAKL